MGHRNALRPAIWRNQPDDSRRLPVAAGFGDLVANDVIKATQQRKFQTPTAPALTRTATAPVAFLGLLHPSTEISALMIWMFDRTIFSRPPTKWDRCPSRTRWDWRGTKLVPTLEGLNDDHAPAAARTRRPGIWRFEGWVVGGGVARPRAADGLVREYPCGCHWRAGPVLRQCSMNAVIRSSRSNAFTPADT